MADTLQIRATTVSPGMAPPPAGSIKIGRSASLDSKPGASSSSSSSSGTNSPRKTGAVSPASNETGVPAAAKKLSDDDNDAADDEEGDGEVTPRETHSPKDEDQPLNAGSGTEEEHSPRSSSPDSSISSASTSTNTTDNYASSSSGSSGGGGAGSQFVPQYPFNISQAYTVSQGPNTTASPGPAPDDSEITTRLPAIAVDYLSHDWSEDDVWTSWKAMTRHKAEIANGVRLENASWRTWAKQRGKLKTISPETLNWYVPCLRLRPP